MLTALRNILFAVALMAPSGVLIGAVHANDILIFHPQAFEQARQSGMPILIETYSAGCSVCWIQEPTVREMMQKPEYSSFRVFVIDADNKAAMRSVGAQTRSTLIVFRNGMEVARAVGITQPNDIEFLLRKAL